MKLLSYLKNMIRVRLSFLFSSRFPVKRCPSCGKALFCKEHGADYIEIEENEPVFAFCLKCSEIDPGWPAVKHLHFDW
jgi:uncharacterized protein with PIN domain